MTIDTATATTGWGPTTWRYLHLMSFVYPQKQSTTEDQNRYQTLFRAVAAVLPCEICRVHFQQHVTSAEFQKALTSSEEWALAKWLTDVHNSVNQRLNKPIKPFAEVKQEYDALCKTMRCGIAVAPKMKKPTAVATNANTAMIVCLCVVGLLCLWGLYAVFFKSL